jgi:hypothetical protein
MLVDEINRQAAQQRNQVASSAVQAGAFGGGREGVQLAEAERARLGLVGQTQAAGFNTALGAAQQAQQAQHSNRTGFRHCWITTTSYATS